MDGIAGVLADKLGINGAVEPSPEDFDATAVIKDSVPPVVGENDIVMGRGQISKEAAKSKMVLGRNVHTMSLEVTEPDADDDVTGDRKAYIASVLSKYKKALIERTKHHLGLTVFAPVFLFAFLIAFT